MNTVLSLGQSLIQHYCISINLQVIFSRSSRTCAWSMSLKRLLSLTSRITSWYLLTIIILLSLGCGDTLEEFNEKSRQQTAEWEKNNPAGVRVVFSSDITKANGDAVLHIKLIADGTEHIMVVGDNEAWLDWDVLNFGPVTSTTDSVDHQYEVFLYYTGGSYYPGARIDMPLLIAKGSQRSDKIRTVIFTEGMLHVTPYDVDGSGDIDQQEKQVLDSDEDGMANLAEILIFGHPINKGPTFVSSVRQEVPEQQKVTTRDNYVVYAAKAVSPRLDESQQSIQVKFRILDVKPGSGVSEAPFIIDADTGKLALDAHSNMPWPVYDETIDNTYVITLEAYELANTTTTELTLTLVITDMFNLTAAVEIKTLRFSWDVVHDHNGDPAAYYKLFQKTASSGEFSQVQGRGKIETTEYVHEFAAFLLDKFSAKFKVEAYTNDNQWFASSEGFFVSDLLINAVAYVKAPDPALGDGIGDFGSVNISADGYTLAVASTIRNSFAGAVFLYTRLTDSLGNPVGPWIYAVTIPGRGLGSFGVNVSLSGNGATLAVGSNDENNSGAVYVFERPLGGWVAWNVTNDIPAYIKAPNAAAMDSFGGRLDFGNDGSILAVSAYREDNSAEGVLVKTVDLCSDDIVKNGQNVCAINSGAVYVLERPSVGGWSSWINGNVENKIAYLKAPNAGAGDKFGISISLSDNGTTLAVGASGEDSSFDGTANPSSDLCTDDAAQNGQNLCEVDSGAVYVFKLADSANWSSSAPNNSGEVTYLKAPNAGAGDLFGSSVSLSGDGGTLAVGAFLEDNAAIGTMDLNSQCAGNGVGIECEVDSGAVYVFGRPANGSWLSWGNNIGIDPDAVAYLKAPNAGVNDRFGLIISLSGDGAVLAVGADFEDGAENGTLGSLFACTDVDSRNDQINCAENSGAVYVFERILIGDFGITPTYNVPIYLKAVNTKAWNHFGQSLSISGNGRLLAVGAPGERGDTSSILGSPIQSIPTMTKLGAQIPDVNYSIPGAGAVYLY